MGSLFQNLFNKVYKTISLGTNVTKDPGDEPSERV